MSERANSTIIEGARCLLHANHLPLHLGGRAISCTVYTLNRVITKAAPNTPYHNWFGNKPDVSNLYIFGSKAYINVPKVERPKGYIESGDEDLVCRLHKCLYGLKQAPRVWNNHFDDFLKRVGLKPSESDPCPYLRHQEDEFTMVIIWVYNALICSSSSETIDEIISEKKARSTSLNLITSRKYFAVIRWTNLIQ